MEISVKGTKQVNQTLRRLERGITDFQPQPFKNIANHYHDLIVKNWKSQGGVWGSWDDLSETTVKIKSENNYPSTPLVRTGTLRDAVLSMDSININQLSLEIFGDGFYNQKAGKSGGANTIGQLFHLHQTGEPNNLPARVMLGLNDRQKKQIGRIVSDYISKTLRGKNV